MQPLPILHVVLGLALSASGCVIGDDDAMQIQGAATVDTASIVKEIDDASAFELETDMQSLQGPLGMIDVELDSKRRKVAWVMDQANRDRETLKKCHPNVYKRVSAQNALYGGFCWDSDTADDSGLWYPQGITTTRDAYDGNTYDGRQLIAVSWYHDQPDQSRLTLVDWDPEWDNKYRHLLLVEPTGGSELFKDANTHAGGIMWYGDLLYVTDSGNRGFRIFSFKNIYSADTSDFCAREVGKVADGLGGYRYCASGYAYIMVQIGWIKLSPYSKYLRLSTISLDRSMTPHRFFIAEYSNPTDKKNPLSDDDNSPNRYHPRVVHWDLDSATYLPAAAQPYAKAVGALSTNIMRMQGIAFHDDKYYFASSHNPKPGFLRSWDIQTGMVRKTDWVVGAESLSYWGGRHNLIWTCTERKNKRVVIAARLDDLGL